LWHGATVVAIPPIPQATRKRLNALERRAHCAAGKEDAASLQWLKQTMKKNNQSVWHDKTTVTSPSNAKASKRTGKKPSALPPQWIKQTRTKKPKQQST